MALLSELEQDPFDGHEFVERLAWRATAGYGSFDARALHDAFESGTRDLRAILDAHHKKCERLESVCAQEEKQHWIRVHSLQERSRAAKTRFEGLDARLIAVAAKVVYLGDQLEGVNTPRARAVEAQRLMTLFASLLADKEPESEVTSDVVQKLSLIAHELPSGPRFDCARQRISAKYDSIERQLIEDFVCAHSRDDRPMMKSVAQTLSAFKGYSACVDAFIERATSGQHRDVSHVFHEIPSLCRRHEPLIREVFPNSDAVLSKLVLNVFLARLQPLVSEALDSSRDERFLSLLYDFYQKTQKMAQQLEPLCERALLHKLTKSVFSRFLQQYIETETRVLRERSALILTRYYESRQHQRRALSSLQELRRDLEKKMGKKGENSQTMGLVSEEVAIALLQEAKEAFVRARLLSRGQELSQNALKVLDVLLSTLVTEHLDYGLELALHESPDPKDLSFLETVRTSNAVMHLLDKQFHDSLLPLVTGTARHGEALKRKRELVDQLESKVNVGLERVLSACIAWIKHLLTTEQKKTDFKPETDDAIVAAQTPVRILLELVNVIVVLKASARVCRFVSSVLERIRDSLDGKNIETFLIEFGLRLHRTLVDHFQQFTFSIVGAMVAICDINEYRKSCALFQQSILNDLFATLHALFNLLIVAPENLKHATEEISLERSVVHSFVQLRADFRSQAFRQHFR